MSRYFPTLPPELWELIIKEHYLYGLKYIKTINTIPSRHCIMDTVYNQLIQPYIDNICKLFYSTYTYSQIIKETLHIKDIISNPYIFNTKNLIDIICYVTDNMKINCSPKIFYYSGHLIIQTNIYNGKILCVCIKFDFYTKSDSIIYCNSTYPIRDVRHRIDGPALVQCTRTGNKISEEYYIDGKLHSIDGPAVIKWYENGNKKKEEYYIDGKLHRIGGPAEIEWYEKGHICTESYFINNIMHRDNGYAYIMYYLNGNKCIEEYKINGKWHRDKGPAVIKWNEDGQKDCEQYYINDIHQYTSDVFFSTSDCDEEDDEY